MNDREMELFVLCVRYAKAYDDSNPDVGMGPSHQMIAEDVAKGLSFSVSKEDIDKAAKLAQKSRRK